MTDTTDSTSYIESIDWTARREAALDKALADLLRFQQEHPGEGIDVPCDVIDTVIDWIFSAPLERLADVRLYAKAMLLEYEHFEQDYDHTRRLLEALAALPQRLWSEPIGEVPQ